VVGDGTCGEGALADGVPPPHALRMTRYETTPIMLARRFITHSFWRKEIEAQAAGRSHGMRASALSQCADRTQALHLPNVSCLTLSRLAYISEYVI
jgi:hypothetical protein